MTIKPALSKPGMNPNQTDQNLATILIVDDIPANLNLLREALEPQGFKIFGVTNGEAALQIAERRVPDLILLDVVMEGIDGFETCQTLKDNPKTAKIPVIFITAKDDTQNVVEGFRVGGVDYITKPFQSEEVCVRVQTHLTIKRLADGLREANGQIQVKNDQLEKANQMLEDAYTKLEADNARKTAELQTAHLVQQGFLPASVPELPFVEVAAFQKPATEVGGDYYDFFQTEADRLLVAVGDATGHGVGASLMVSATKTALMNVETLNLTEMVCRLNQILKRINSYPRLNMALSLVELSAGTGGVVSVKAAGGGMPPLCVLRSDGAVEEVVITGLPLGAMETAEYAATEFHLEKSDVLILMSDGLPERENDAGELLGNERLTAFIEKFGQTPPSAIQIIEALVEYGNDWSNQTEQNDDVTIVVVKVK